MRALLFVSVDVFISKVSALRILPLVLCSDVVCISRFIVADILASLFKVVALIV